MLSKKRKNEEKLKLHEKASKNCRSITNIFEKACDKTSVLQDSLVVNTTTAARSRYNRPK